MGACKYCGSRFPHLAYADSCEWEQTALDYTAIPKALFDTCERAGAPLSEDQKMLIAGGLASYQGEIERQGLERVIQNVMRKTNG